MPRSSGYVPVKPVLDAFADNQEVALDEALDDLTVPLLPRAQLAGCRHCLAKKRQSKMLTVCNEFSSKVFCPTANPTTHCVEEVNGLAFAGAAKACRQGSFFRNLLVLPALPSIKGLCLTARNPYKSEGQSNFG